MFAIVVAITTYQATVAGWFVSYQNRSTAKRVQRQAPGVSTSTSKNFEELRNLLSPKRLNVVKPLFNPRFNERNNKGRVA